MQARFSKTLLSSDVLQIRTITLRISLYLISGYTKFRTLLICDAHMNAQYVTSRSLGKYLTKYVLKPDLLIFLM